jgi:branched-chain amino acid transport system substrate-binding protein
MSPKRSLRACLLLVSALVAMACGAPQSQDGGSGGGSDTIKIGLLRPITGTVAASGKDMENGWNLYWKQKGTTVAGKKVETVAEDSAGNPSVGLNKAVQLTSSAHVDVIVGPLLANVGLAVAEAMNRQGVPTVLPIVSADDLTQRKRLDFASRVAGWTSSQPTHPLGAYAAEQGYKTAVAICTDYAFGYENCGGFTNTFTDNGGKVVKVLWNPLGTPDFSPYMAQIKQIKPDVVFTEQVGADSVRFVKAWADFGLKNSDIQLLGNETLLDASVLRNMGDEAVGLISAGHFAEGRPDPVAKKFADDYFAAYGNTPSYYAADMYTAAGAIASAIETLKGDVSDKKAFVKALNEVSLENTPMGPETMDEYGNPIFNVYIRKVEQGPHGLWNVPVKTYEKVSQFWTYDPQEFLKHPVYSKTYQGNGAWPDPAS